MKRNRQRPAPRLLRDATKVPARRSLAAVASDFPGPKVRRPVWTERISEKKTGMLQLTGLLYGFTDRSSVLFLVLV